MTVIEKQQIKEVLLELITENKHFFKEIVKEIILEKINEIEQEEETRNQKIEAIIKKDFQRYKKVFEALA
jgi:formiminotetrahydrofolate cyclodeaminase